MEVMEGSIPLLNQSVDGVVIHHHTNGLIVGLFSTSTTIMYMKHMRHIIDI